MKHVSLGNFNDKKRTRIQLDARIQVTKEAWLNSHDFVWLEQNLPQLSCIAAKLNFSVCAQEGMIALTANRLRYSVEIRFLADDNLTGLPKVTIDVFTYDAFLPLLEDVARQELASLIHGLHGYSPFFKPISDRGASKPWPQPDLALADGR